MDQAFHRRYVTSQLSIRWEADNLPQVAFEDRSMHVYSFEHDREKVIQEVYIRPGLKRRLRNDKPSYPNRGTFLVHSACYRLLNDGMPFSSDPAELFNPFQVLEPDELRFPDPKGPPTAGTSIRRASELNIHC